jgi:propionyl-CoA carboxylase beta chain
MDKGSFEELGMLVTHRATDFGIEKEKYLAMVLLLDLEQ